MRASLQENGRVVLEDIEVRVGASDRDEGAQWFGSFDLPPDGEIKEGGRYRLMLSDGRSGEIAIENAQPNQDRVSVGFMGVGPLK